MNLHMPLVIYESDGKRPNNRLAKMQAEEVTVEDKEIGTSSF